jgi:hypothetical protein
VQAEAPVAGALPHFELPGQFIADCNGFMI